METEMENPIVCSMQKVCEAASDYVFGLHNKEFAQKCGGIESLQKALILKTHNYESNCDVNDI